MTTFLPFKQNFILHYFLSLAFLLCMEEGKFMVQILPVTGYLMVLSEENLKSLLYDVQILTFQVSLVF